MSGRDALLRAYKERKVEAGVYAVRCAATDEVWVTSDIVNVNANADGFDYL